MEHTPILPASAPLGAPERFLPAVAGVEPIAAVARALSGFNRDQLGSAIEVLIALMDVADGDPETEDATDVEDDFVLTANAIEQATSMPRVDCIDQDAGAYVEWHTLPPSSRRAGVIDGKPTDLHGNYVHEDDEEDDAAEEDDDSGSEANEDEPDGFALTRWMEAPGCPIADPHDEQETVAASWPVDQTKGPLPYQPHAADKPVRQHRDRIRRERCDKLPQADYLGRTHALRESVE